MFKVSQFLVNFNFKIFSTISKYGEIPIYILSKKKILHGTILQSPRMYAKFFSFMMIPKIYEGTHITLLPRKLKTVIKCDFKRQTHDLIYFYDRI